MICRTVPVTDLQRIEAAAAALARAGTIVDSHPSRSDLLAVRALRWIEPTIPHPTVRSATVDRSL